MSGHAFQGPIIEVRALRKRYRRVEALRGLDLTVPRGTVFGFLGPNGAGKTTTMKILMGLIRPTAGEAFLFGRDAGHSGPAVRSRVGYLPQDPAFHPERTVREVLKFVGRLYPGGRNPLALRRRVDALIERVGLTGKARRRVRALSGGERQRLGIAQALIGEPELLILDEPSAGLDPRGRREVIDLIDEVRADTTVFYSTHILDDVQRVSDAVAIIGSGRTLAQGPIGEILAAPTDTYTALLHGETGGLVERMRAEPWVSSVEAAPRGEAEEWTIRLADGAAADRLLPLLAGQAGCDVVEYHLSDRRLEDAYLEIVGATRGE
jgi:ABC-2 type transport system ATP-binding protein